MKLLTTQLSVDGDCPHTLGFGFQCPGPSCDQVNFGYIPEFGVHGAVERFLGPFPYQTALKFPRCLP
jgi:hypothetical protein